MIPAILVVGSAALTVLLGRWLLPAPQAEPTEGARDEAPCIEEPRVPTPEQPGSAPNSVATATVAAGSAPNSVATATVAAGTLSSDAATSTPSSVLASPASVPGDTTAAAVTDSAAVQESQAHRTDAAAAVSSHGVADAVGAGEVGQLQLGEQGMPNPLFRGLLAAVASPSHTQHACSSADESHYSSGTSSSASIRPSAPAVPGACPVQQEQQQQQQQQQVSSNISQSADGATARRVLLPDLEAAAAAPAAAATTAAAAAGAPADADASSDDSFIGGGRLFRAMLAQLQPRGVDAGQTGSRLGAEPWASDRSPSAGAQQQVGSLATDAAPSLECTHAAAPQVPLSEDGDDVASATAAGAPGAPPVGGGSTEVVREPATTAAPAAGPSLAELAVQQQPELQPQEGVLSGEAAAPSAAETDDAERAPPQGGTVVADDQVAAVDTARAASVMRLPVPVTPYAAPTDLPPTPAGDVTPGQHSEAAGSGTHAPAQHQGRLQVPAGDSAAASTAAQLQQGADQPCSSCPAPVTTATVQAQDAAAVSVAPQPAAAPVAGAAAAGDAGDGPVLGERSELLDQQHPGPHMRIHDHMDVPRRHAPAGDEGGSSADGSHPGLAGTPNAAPSAAPAAACGSANTIAAALAAPPQPTRDADQGVASSDMRPAALPVPAAGPSESAAAAATQQQARQVPEAPSTAVAAAAPAANQQPAVVAQQPAGTAGASVVPPAHQVTAPDRQPDASSSTLLGAAPSSQGEGDAAAAASGRCNEAAAGAAVTPATSTVAGSQPVSSPPLDSTSSSAAHADMGAAEAGQTDMAGPAKAALAPALVPRPPVFALPHAVLQRIFAMAATAPRSPRSCSCCSHPQAVGCCASPHRQWLPQHQSMHHLGYPSSSGLLHLGGQEADAAALAHAEAAQASMHPPQQQGRFGAVQQLANPKHTVAALRLVCRSWRQVVDGAVRCVAARDWPHHMARLQGFTHLEELDLCGLGVDRAPLSRVLPLLLHLNELPRLARLTLSKDMLVVSHRFASTAVCAELSLVVSGPAGLGLLEGLTSLRVVRMAHRGLAASFDAFSMPGHAKSATQRGVWLSIRMRPELSCLTRLTQLELHDTVNPLQFVPTTLRSLTLVGRACCAAAPPEQVAPLKQLTSITLHDVVGGALLAGFLAAARAACPNLVQLSLQAVQMGPQALQHAQLLGDAEWGAIAAMPRLRRLEVWATPNSGIDALALILQPLGPVGVSLDLPAHVQLPVSLVELQLPGNGLTTLPPSLLRLGHLTRLDLARSSMPVLPPGLLMPDPSSPAGGAAARGAAGLVALQHLNLQGCLLTSVPGLRALFSLRCLDLRNNNLASLPDCLADLVQLTRLMVGHNALTGLPACVYDLTQLRVFEAAFNAIRELGAGVSRLTHLASLDMAYNRLAALPHSLAALHGSLTRLRLGCNMLRAMPQVVLQLSRLTHLDLSAQNTVHYEHGRGIIVLSHAMWVGLDVFGDYTMRGTGTSTAASSATGSRAASASSVQRAGGGVPRSLLGLPRLRYLLADCPTDAASLHTCTLLQAKGVQVAFAEGPTEQDSLMWLGDDPEGPAQGEPAQGTSCEVCTAERAAAAQAASPSSKYGSSSSWGGAAGRVSGPGGPSGAGSMLGAPAAPHHVVPPVAQGIAAPA